MRFFQIVASGAAFISAALAVEINQYPSGGVKAGQTYTVTYSPADDTPTTFILRKGLSTDLGTIGTLTSTATGGTFSWTVASDLVDGEDYALEIQQAGESPNYSAQFGLTGGSGSSSSSAAASSTSAGYPVSSVASASVSRSSAASASASSAAASSAYSASSASASASLTSLVSSVRPTGTASVSGSIVPSGSHNGTISTATLSAGLPESTGAASSLSSAPLALLFGVAGAFAFLN